MRRRWSTYTRSLPTRATSSLLTPWPRSKVSSQFTLTRDDEKLGRSSANSVCANAAFSGVGASTVGAMRYPGMGSKPSGASAQLRYGSWASQRPMWPKQFWLATSSMPAAAHVSSSHRMSSAVIGDASRHTTSWSAYANVCSV